MNMRKGDKVKIISGNDRGKTGIVRGVFPKEERIVVEGVFVKKKHVRPRASGQKGEVVRMPLPFSASRAMLVCPACGKPVRVRSRSEGGRKMRVCAKCGGQV